MSLNLHDLIHKPFPKTFDDSDVLSTDWKRCKGPRVPTLTDVVMRPANSKDRETTGLDITEALRYKSYRRDVTKHVEFEGTLIIEQLKWLSSRGRNLCERQLRLRDQEINGVQESRLTLRALYSNDSPFGRGPKIKIRLRCFKREWAAPFTSSANKEDLIFQSDDERRLYRIESLELPTYLKSRNYLQRYHLVNFMHSLVSSGHNRLLQITECTPSRFITEYLRAAKQHNQSQRYNYDPTAVSYHDTGGVVHSHLVKLRRDHVTIEQVASLFAAHAEWLLGNELLPKKASKLKAIHIPSLIAFIKTAREARKKAKRNGITWGCPPDSSPQSYSPGSGLEDIARDVERFCGGNWSDWLKMIERHCDDSSDVELVDNELDQHPRAHLKYDPDYSDSSDSEVYDSDYLSEDSSLDRPAPLFTTRLPVVQDNGEWCCLGPGCDFELALGNLTEEQVTFLDARYSLLGIRFDHGRNLKAFLQSFRWSRESYLSSREVQWAFEELVNRHYLSHCEDVGLRVILPDEVGGECMIENV